MTNTFVHIVDIPERKADNSYVAQSTIFDSFRNAILAQEPLAAVISVQEKALLPPPQIPNWSRATRFEVRFPSGQLQLGAVRLAVDSVRASLGLQPCRIGYTERVEEIR